MHIGKTAKCTTSSFFHLNWAKMTEVGWSLLEQNPKGFRHVMLHCIT